MLMTLEGDTFPEGREPSTEPQTPVAKAFFDTALGHGCAAALVLGGWAGATVGAVTGDPLLAGSSSLLCINAIPLAVSGSRGKRVSKFFQLAPIGVAAMFTALAISINQSNKNIAALPELASDTIITIPEQRLIIAEQHFTAKELYCPPGKRGVIEVNDAKRGIVGKKLNCG